MNQADVPRETLSRRKAFGDAGTFELSAAPESAQRLWMAIVPLIGGALYAAFLIGSGMSWHEVLFDSAWPEVGMICLALCLLFATMPPFWHVRVFQSGNDLLVSPVSGWKKIPLEQVLRISPARHGSDAARQGVRIEYANGDGSRAEIEFKPHPRFTRDDPGADALRQYLEREVLRVKHPPPASVPGGTVREMAIVEALDGGAVLDLRASAACVDDARDHAMLPVDGDDDAVLSRSSAYMRRWYPREWLFLPAIMLASAVVVGVLLQWWPWPMLVMAAFVATKEWLDRRLERRVAMIADVAMRGDWLWFSYDGTPTRLALSDVLDVSVRSCSHRPGRDIVILHYVRGSHVLEAGFLPKHASWFGWGAVEACADRLRERVSKAAARRDPTRA